MKIFLSWSGNRGRALAEALRDWLPLIHGVEPWLSTEMERGVRWGAELESGLKESRAGVVCLTKDSLTSPWLLFEAGAISKAIEKTLVCPYLLDVEPGELPGPLQQFQTTRAEKDETRKLVHSINRMLGERARPEGTVDKTFEHLWPVLEAALKAIPAHGPGRKIEQVMLDDERTKQVVRMHQASIAFRISTVIDDTLNLLETDPNAFDSDDFFNAIYAAILEGRDLAVGFANRKVGDLVEFFEDSFTKEELREVTRGIEGILRNPTIKPIAKRTMLFRKISATEEEVFTRLRKKLNL